MITSYPQFLQVQLSPQLQFVQVQLGLLQLPLKFDFIRFRFLKLVLIFLRQKYSRDRARDVHEKGNDVYNFWILIADWTTAYLTVSNVEQLIKHVYFLKVDKPAVQGRLTRYTTNDMLHLKPGVLTKFFN